MFLSYFFLKYPQRHILPLSLSLFLPHAPPSIQRHVIASFFRTLALSVGWFRLIHQTNGGRSDCKIQALIMVSSSFSHHSLTPPMYVNTHNQVHLESVSFKMYNNGQNFKCSYFPFRLHFASKIINCRD